MVNTLWKELVLGYFTQKRVLMTACGGAEYSDTLFREGYIYHTVQGLSTWIYY